MTRQSRTKKTLALALLFAHSLSLSETSYQARPFLVSAYAVYIERTIANFHYGSKTSVIIPDIKMKVCILFSLPLSISHAHRKERVGQYPKGHQDSTSSDTETTRRGRKDVRRARLLGVTLD